MLKQNLPNIVTDLLEISSSEQRQRLLNCQVDNVNAISSCLFQFNKIFLAN